MSKYTVNNSSIETILGWINGGEIAIPEIQRPFVWDSSKVRDLMDSLYQGYPVGYIITWRNPDTNLKDGTKSLGKKILIDGQQRVTALTAALLGQEVVGADYKKKRIRIVTPLKKGLKYRIQPLKRIQSGFLIFLNSFKDTSIYLDL
jgi:uncharacterized protein with ParB-like and HNH nuclease domain